MGSGGWSTARFTVGADEEAAAATAKNCTTAELQQQ
jgi:hypothetical protein